MPRPPAWEKLSNQELLEWRLCDLGLTLEGSGLEAPIDRLYRELEARNLRVRPHCWLSEEWFSPEGVPGIALPFYLAHPRLKRLERAQINTWGGHATQTRRSCCARMSRTRTTSNIRSGAYTPSRQTTVPARSTSNSTFLTAAQARPGRHQGAAEVAGPRRNRRPRYGRSVMPDPGWPQSREQQGLALDHLARLHGPLQHIGEEVEKKVSLG